MSDTDLGQAVLEDVGADHSKARLYVAGKLLASDGRHWLAVASVIHKAALIRVLLTVPMDVEDERSILMILRNEVGANLGRLVAELGRETMERLRETLGEQHRQLLASTLKWIDG